VSSNGDIFIVMCLQCLCCYHRLSSSEECLIILVRCEAGTGKHQGGLCELCDVESVQTIFGVLEAVRTACPSNGSKLYKGIEVRRSLDPVLGYNPRACSDCVVNKQLGTSRFLLHVDDECTASSHGWRCPSCEIYKRIQTVSITTRYNTPQMIS